MTMAIAEPVAPAPKKTRKPAKPPVVPIFTVLSETSRMPDPRAWLKTADYQLCPSLDALWAYAQPALTAPIHVGLDWETSSLDIKKAFLVGCSISVAPGSARYVPIGHWIGAEHNLPEQGVREVLDAIATAQSTFVFWNYRYDSSVMLRQWGWEPPFSCWADAMIAVWLQNNSVRTYNLKDTAQRILGLDMIEFAEITQGRHFQEIPPEEAVLYACPDADLPRRMYLLPHVQRAIKEQGQIWQIEREFLLALREGTQDGVFLDRAHLMRLQQQIGGAIKDEKKKKIITPVSGLIKEVQDRIFAAAGGPFAIESRPTLGKVLLGLGIPIEERTEKNDQVSTGVDILEKYVHTHPIVRDLIQYAELTAQDRNYIQKLIAAVDHFGPQVRFAFNQFGAPTGRMSAGGEGKKVEAFGKGVADVNIQSFPDHEKKPYLPNIRSSVVANDPTHPSDEWVIVSLDFNQIEMRVAANLSREPLWIRAFLKGEDFHLKNAQLAYDDPTIVKTDRRRQHGKTVNFAVLFGASASTAARHGGISVKQAQKLLDNFFGKATTLKTYIDNTKVKVENMKFSKTWFGRVRPLGEYFEPGVTREVREEGYRLGVNTEIQGSAADLFKVACSRVHKLLHDRGWHHDWHQRIWVHDEVDFWARRSTLATVLPEVLKTMTLQVVGWPVPIIASAEIGWDWGHTRAAADWMRLHDALDPQLVSWLPIRTKASVSSPVEETHGLDDRFAGYADVSALEGIGACEPAL